MLTTFLLVTLLFGVVIWTTLFILERAAARQSRSLRYTRRVGTSRQYVGRPGVITAERQACPLWQLRGWRRQGKWLIGAFRTKRGACAGEILLNWRGRAQDYYLYNPPRALLAGSHGPCFKLVDAKRQRYWIHFRHFTGDIDSGIVAVERLLADALKS